MVYTGDGFNPNFGFTKAPVQCVCVVVEILKEEEKERKKEKKCHWGFKWLSSPFLINCKPPSKHTPTISSGFAVKTATFLHKCV